MREGLSGPRQQKTIVSPALFPREGEMVSAAQGGREVAFPHLNPNGLGRLPEWRAREALRQER